MSEPLKGTSFYALEAEFRKLGEPELAEWMRLFADSFKLIDEAERDAVSDRDLRMVHTGTQQLDSVADFEARCPHCMSLGTNAGEPCSRCSANTTIPGWAI